jgi:3-oxoacyl-[acyl-carrier protein] reductase
MSGLLHGRVAVITGSTRGIGRAMAEAFSREGARVVVNGRRARDAEAVSDAIAGSISVGGDVSKQDTVDEIVARATNELGCIDILVNNAAIARPGAVTRVNDEDWDEAIKVNLTAPMRLGRAVVPVMKRQGSGVILNVISAAGTHGVVGYTSYAASKGGLVGLTMTWAKELARFNIRCNALSPAAATDLLGDVPDDIRAGMEANLPSPEQVSGVAVFLCSDLAELVNGQIVGAGAPGR